MAKTEVPDGVCMNIQSSAACLVDDAIACRTNPTPENRRDFLASMRIMVHRIEKAMRELGEKL